MSDQAANKNINGVDVRKLKETIQAISEKPVLAGFKFRIANQWQGGGLNQSTVKASYGVGQEFSEREGKFTMQADEPPVLLSGDKAANPVEHLLHALISCVTTTAVYHAAARHISVDGIESTLEGDLDLQGFLGLDPNVPKGYAHQINDAHQRRSKRGEKARSTATWLRVLSCIQHGVKGSSNNRRAVKMKHRQELSCNTPLVRRNSAYY